MVEEPRANWYLPSAKEILSEVVTVVTLSALAVAGAAFVGFAKQAWSVSPYWSGALAVGLAVASGGLLVLWLQRAARKALYERRASSATVLENLVNLRNTAVRLLANCPDPRKHIGEYFREWNAAVDTVLQSAESYRDEEPLLPHDIAVLIHNPTHRPQRLKGVNESDPQDVKIGRLALVVQGFAEAAEEYAARERLPLSLEPVEGM